MNHFFVANISSKNNYNLYISRITLFIIDLVYVLKRDMIQNN